jgi:hypothetical protein
LAYRAFYALPAENFSTHTGQHTNAVYGFTSMLINMLRDEAPTHIAVAFDVSRKTFRTEAYADYKAGRSATPSEFEGQISLVQEILGALRIPFVQVDGYEADDVIATLTTMATADGMEVLISSGDRDAFQLVTDTVTVLYPVRGVSELWRMTPAAIEEKYGVPPTHYSDLAALVGESSDNLPGSPGSAPRPRPSGSGCMPVSTGSSRTSTRSAGRPESRCASTWTRCCATAGSTNSSATCRSRSGWTIWCAARGIASRCTRSSTRWSSGSCASACSRPSRPRNRRPSRASTSTDRSSPPVRWPTG